MANEKPDNKDPRTDNQANGKPKSKEPANRVRMLKDQTPQQRAAKITYHLALRALAGLEGMTTSQVATMLGISYHAARALMINLEAAGTPPITMQEGRWVMVDYHLRVACRPVRMRRE